MPQAFTLVQKRYGPQGPRRVRKPISQNSYFEHIDFDSLVVQRKDSPRPDVFYYNKPHDQFCFAHITMLSSRWQPHDYEFHVTVYVPDEPPVPNTMELVYQKTEQVRYRAVKTQQQWTYVTLPPRAALNINTPTCAQQYAEAFISYLNDKFRQYYGGRRVTRNCRQLSRARRKKLIEARQVSGAKSIATLLPATITTLYMTKSVRPNYATLQQQVLTSFTARADFMPATLTYWYYSADDEPTRTTVKPSRLAAHPVMKLAHTAQRGEDLPLLLPYTQKGAPGISVCQREWDTAGIFEVDYYQADSYKEELCFTRCAFLKCQVQWGAAPKICSDFYQNDTTISQNDCLQVANVFVDFLHSEFCQLSSPRSSTSTYD